MKNYQKIIAVVAASIACAEATSHATLTQLGSISDTSATTSLPAFQGSYGPVTGGSPVLTMQGTLTSWVLTTDSTQAGFTGNTFVYQINETGDDVVALLTLNGFAASANYAIGFVSKGLPFDPTTIVQNAAGLINITFGNDNGFTGLGDYIYIYTNVKQSGLVADPLQDGVNSSAIAESPVPEPTTIAAGALMLLPLGLGAMRSLRKDRSA